MSKQKFRDEVKKGNIEYVRIWISENPAENDEIFTEAFNISCYSGNLEMVKLLISLTNIDPFQLNNKALINAVYRDHFEVVKFLVEYKSIPLTQEEKNDIANTSLEMNKTADILKYIIEKGARIDQQLLFETPSFILKVNNINILKCLLLLDVNKDYGKPLPNFMTSCAVRGFSEVIELFKDNFPGDLINTLLWIAGQNLVSSTTREIGILGKMGKLMYQLIELGNKDVLELVIDWLDSTQIDDSENNALYMHSAIKVCDVDSLKILLKNKTKKQVDLYANNRELINNIMKDAFIYNKVDIVKYVFELDKEYPFPPELLTFSEGKEVIDEIFSMEKITLYQHNFNDIRREIIDGSILVSKLYIKYTDIDLCEENNTLLINAAENGHTEIVDLLLKNIKSNISRDATWAFINCCAGGYLDTAILMSKDRRVNMSGENNRALIKANENGHTEIVKFLMSNYRVNYLARKMDLKIRTN